MITKFIRRCRKLKARLSDWYAEACVTPIFSITLLFVLGMILICAFSIGRPNYTVTATVISVKGQIAVYEDEAGYVWTYRAGDRSVGDKVTLHMDDHGTTTRYDDTIERVQ